MNRDTQEEQWKQVDSIGNKWYKTFYMVSGTKSVYVTFRMADGTPTETKVTVYDGELVSGGDESPVYVGRVNDDGSVERTRGADRGLDGRIVDDIRGDLARIVGLRDAMRRLRTL